MSDGENVLRLPEPLKVKPSISRYLDKLETEGTTIWAFEGAFFIETLFYLHLINKYKSKCIASGTTKGNYRPIGITIPFGKAMNANSALALVTEYNEVSKTIVDCVKRNEKMILIPLNYLTTKIGHANMLIYKVNNNIIEHFEPHGDQFKGMKTIQNTAEKMILRFINTLNDYLRKNGLHEARYLEASQVCPYIKGFQSMEEASTLKRYKDLESAGYCSAWSYFFAELNLKNPSLSSDELLENVYNYLTTKDSAGNYLRSVIRGYTGYIYHVIDRYLEIFFKPRIRIENLIGKSAHTANYSKMIKIADVLSVLVSLELANVTDPTFNYKKELKKVMKEYKEQTHGKSKDEQRQMRSVDANLRELYYKKRILQNYEEYKNDEPISEPVFVSEDEMEITDIKNLAVIQKRNNPVAHGKTLSSKSKSNRKRKTRKTKKIHM